MRLQTSNTFALLAKAVDLATLKPRVRASGDRSSKGDQVDSWLK